MSRQEERRERYRELREAGFTSQEARRLRDSGVRTEAALRTREEGRPVEEARFQASRPRAELEREQRRIDAQQAFRRYRSHRPTTDEKQRERWGKRFKQDKIPKTWSTVQRDYFLRLREQGVPESQAKSIAWGLTFQTVMKEDFTPQTLTQADIQSYLMERRL